jgi:serine/threonine protein kinase
VIYRGIRSGQILGAYQVTEVLGEGGMGVVLGALDTKLQRRVAIKFLPCELADAGARARFQREAQLASSLNHPHILTVHDVGEFDGQAYLVTEFVDGGTLKDWSAAEPRNWRQIVDLLVGVADALAAAHQAGILHRDVKPQNVLVTKSGYAKLADFGLAKLSEGATEATMAAMAIATHFTPSSREDEPGTLSEIPALGGTPRRLALAATGADVSHDGRRIVAVQKTGDGFELAILDRDGTPAGEPIPIAQSKSGLFTPRWSPDDRSLAFVLDEGGFRFSLRVVDAAGGSPKVIAVAAAIDGIAWLPDGSGLVYASSPGSMLYPPIMNLRMVSRDGAVDRQLTVGDQSYVQPDLVQGRRLFASRVRLQADIWGFPVSGSASENVRNGTRITRQTGLVQTPSVSPDGKEIAHLSDTGGHSNVWVASIDGSRVRQVTFERDPSAIIGIPLWSPDGERIVFIRASGSVNSEWIVNTDGSNPRQLVPRGVAAAWSADGRWLYYQNGTCIHKIPSDGGTSIQVRCNAGIPIPSSDEKTLYYTDSSYRNATAIFKAALPDGEGVMIAKYPGARVPAWPTGYVLSPDDRWIALPLKDGTTTNIWAIPTSGGPFRQLTDFGRRAILIARQVSWSRDGKMIYAAVLETDADVVLLDGIVP